MDQELLTTAELAERMKVTSETIARWRRRGRIPYIRINSTTLRHEYAAVVEALRTASNKSEGTPCPS